MNNAHPFSLGLTYRPRQGVGPAINPYGWRAVDVGATRDELAHIAELGCDTVRLCLHWEDFQPGPTRIGSPAMRALERILDAVQSARLHAVVALFPAGLGNAVQVPFWATGIRPGVEMALETRFGPLLIVNPASQPPVLYEGRYHATPVRDLYRDPEQQQAQRYLIAEVIGYFAAHPAIHTWQLGHGLEYARTPRSAEDAYEWLANQVEQAREHGATRLASVVTAYGLSRQDTLRPHHLAELCDSLIVHTLPATPLRVTAPWHPAYVTFLHALTASLAGHQPAPPIVMANLGLATRSGEMAGWVVDSAFGRSTYTYLADEEQQAAFVADSLTALYRAGVAGVWLAAYADAAPELWTTPPFDQSIRERSLGLVRADGREKPAAAALRDFAARLRQNAPGTPGAPPDLDLDPADYWRAPAGTLRRLFQEWRSAGEA